MSLDEETIKYYRLLIHLRRAAAQLDALSEFELLMIADAISISGEDELRRFARSNRVNDALTEGASKHE